MFVHSLTEKFFSYGPGFHDKVKKTYDLNKIHAHDAQGKHLCELPKKRQDALWMVPSEGKEKTDS